MKLANPSATLLKPEQGKYLEFIETIARTCYKSEPSGNTSQFIKNLVSHEHYAMLEHLVFVFGVSESLYQKIIRNVGTSNPYIHCTYNYHGTYNYHEDRYLISGNVRALNEYKVLPLLYYVYRDYPELIYSFKDITSPRRPCWFCNLSELPNLTEEELDNHLYTTFHFVCDRGVSHELVRHRCASFAQESTRYCNYSKDKFGNSVTFIKPTDFNNWSGTRKELFLKSCEESEKIYMNLLEDGCTPEQARCVLPNSLKTEIVVTASHKEWKHIFNLRYKGTTGKPHPDMSLLMSIAYVIYNERVSKI